MFNYRPDRPVALRVTVELPTLRDRPQQPPVFDAGHPGVDALLHPDRDGHRRIRRPFSSRSARTPTFPLLDGLDDVVAFALQVSRCAQIPDGVQMNVVQGFRCNLGKTGNLRGSELALRSELRKLPTTDVPDTISWSGVYGYRPAKLRHGYDQWDYRGFAERTESTPETS